MTTTTVAPYRVLLDGDDVTRKDWLDARRQGIGGSDAPAVLGWGGYHSALDVYADKVSGVHSDDDDDEQLAWGRLLEGVIADEWARRCGVQVRKAPALVQSTRWPHMVASVDRIEVVDGEDVGIVECKNRAAWVAGDWETAPPADVTAQGLHYAAVYGLRRVSIACLVGGNELRTFQIDPDDEVLEALAAAEADWWEKHVVARVLPDLEPTRDESSALARLFPNAAGSIELDAAGVALLRERWIAHQNYNAAKEARSQIDDRVRRMLGDKVEGLIKGKKFVTWSAPAPGQRSCDYDRLQRDFPDAYAACVTTGEPTRRLTYARKEIPS